MAEQGKRNRPVVKLETNAFYVNEHNCEWKKKDLSKSNISTVHVQYPFFHTTSSKICRKKFQKERSKHKQLWSMLQGQWNPLEKSHTKKKEEEKVGGGGECFKMKFCLIKYPYCYHILSLVVVLQFLQ